MVFSRSVVALTVSLACSGLAHATPYHDRSYRSLTQQTESASLKQSPDARVHAERTHRILQIFQKTQAAIRLLNFPVATSISMTSSPHASAFVYKRKSILLSERLVDLLQTEEQLAFAISHEMAHIALGHTAESGDQGELAADAFAVALLSEIGMDSCASTSALETLKSREPLYKEPLSQRQEHLHKTLLSHCPWKPRS